MSIALTHWRTLRRTAALIVAFLGAVSLGVAASTGLATSRATTGSPTAAVAAVAVGVLGLATAIAGLLLFWVLVKEFRFVRSGYRIRPAGPYVLPFRTLDSGEWIYDERDSEGRIRSLPFVRIVLGQGYPAHTELELPNEEEWKTIAPEWARGRRALIIERLIASAGGPSVARIADHGGGPTRR